MNRTLKIFIHALLLMSFSLDATSKKNQDSICVICHEKIQKKTIELDDGTYYTLKKREKKLPCNHLFHTKCIKKWYISDNKNSNQCPLCRADYVLPLTKNNLLFASKYNPDLIVITVLVFCMGIGAFLWVSTIIKKSLLKKIN